MTEQEEKQGAEDTWLADNEVMDLSALKDKTFAVAVASGDPNGVKFLCSTIHGPYNFVDMAQEVGDMWVKHTHHAKVILLDKNPTQKVFMLSENTVDYIECHYVDIIMEEALSGALAEKQFTCTAELVVEEPIKTDALAKS